jgi:hypothetical protein
MRDIFEKELKYYGSLDKIYKRYPNIDNYERAALSNAGDKFWYSICADEVLSEEFMADFSDSLVWAGISCHQKLTEGFIEKFADKIDWVIASKYQKFSRKIIIKNINKLYLNKIPLCYFKIDHEMGWKTFL